jgi:hypothetical protein
VLLKLKRKLLKGVNQNRSQFKIVFVRTSSMLPITTRKGRKKIKRFELVFFLFITLV